MQTAKSGQKLKEQLCALGGLGGTDHSHLPHQDCSRAVSVVRCDKYHLKPWEVATPPTLP